jgi:hypothetical protein
MEGEPSTHKFPRGYPKHRKIQTHAVNVDTNSERKSGLTFSAHRLRVIGALPCMADRSKLVWLLHYPSRGRMYQLYDMDKKYKTNQEYPTSVFYRGFGEN